MRRIVVRNCRGKLTTAWVLGGCRGAHPSPTSFTSIWVAARKTKNGNVFLKSPPFWFLDLEEEDEVHMWSSWERGRGIRLHRLMLQEKRDREQPQIKNNEINYHVLNWTLEQIATLSPKKREAARVWFSTYVVLSRDDLFSLQPSCRKNMFSYFMCFMFLNLK